MLTLALSLHVSVRTNILHLVACIIRRSQTRTQREGGASRLGGATDFAALCRARAQRQRASQRCELSHLETDVMLWHGLMELGQGTAAAAAAAADDKEKQNKPDNSCTTRKASTTDQTYKKRYIRMGRSDLAYLSESACDFVSSFEQQQQHSAEWREGERRCVSVVCGLRILSDQ